MDGPGWGERPGRDRLPPLYRSLIDDSQLMFLALRQDGVIAYASPAARQLMGTDPDELVGTNVLHRLHPADVDRALMQIATGTAAGVTPGITRFGVRHHDGRWVPVEIWANEVTDGREPLIGIYARDGSHQVFLEDVMTMLLQGVPRREALVPVCDTIQWHGAGSAVAIDWIDGDGHHQVNTGVPEALGGAPGPEEPGSERNPWARCRATGAGVEGTAADLHPARAALAASAQACAYWIEPVHWSDTHPPATVTIWTGEGRAPAIHVFGMEMARRIVELILRWTEQVAELDRAARLDPLTGLANRRAFFDALRRSAGGAVLYCDLDRFKPVNDELGHAAGDELLRLVARRIEHSVRDADVVARLGGDEFAVLCAGATEPEATEIARRIRSALRDPFDLDGRRVTVGISVGVGFDATGLNEEVLARADRALGTDKAGRRR